MREPLIVAAAVGVLTGCAAPSMQTASPAPDPAEQTRSVQTPGRTADLEPTMSSAGRTLLDQGRTQRLAGEYQQASASLERALRVDPQQALIWLELGRLRLDEGNFAQAEQMARKALSLAPAGDSVQSQAEQLIDESRRAAGR